MKKSSVAASCLALIAAFSGSTSALAAKPSKSVEAEPYLEGPIVNPGSESASTSLSAGAMYYGDNAGFIQRNILLSNNQRSYVTVVCLQGDTVVYQASQWGADMLVFTLEDLDGQGLEWYAGSGPASCTATLILNEKKGRKTTITQLDQVAFEVL